MNWTRRLPDYILVIFITILIWLYAEAQNVQTWEPADPVPVSIELGQRRFVQSQNHGSFQPILRGAVSEIQKAREFLAAGVTLKPEVDPKSSNQQILLEKEIQRELVARNIHVNLVRVTPKAIDITIDSLVNHQCPIRVRPNQTYNIKDARFTPSFINVELPQSVLDEFRKTLVLDALIDFQSMVNGANETKSAPARVQFLDEKLVRKSIRLTQTTVTVNFKLADQNETITLPSTPIWIQGPSEDLMRHGQIKVEPKYIAGLKIRGTAARIKQFKQSDEKVVAYVSLDDTLLSKLAVEAQRKVPIPERTKVKLYYHLPPGIQIVSTEMPTHATVIVAAKTND